IAIASGIDLTFVFIPAALSWLLQVIVMAIVSKRSGVSVVYALTAPLGLALIYAMLFDSGVRITTGRGVTWKGRRIYERRGVRTPLWRAASSRIPKREKYRKRPPRAGLVEHRGANSRGGPPGPPDRTQRCGPSD